MTAIKRKEKKSLFYLIAIAIMVAIMSIACSNSPVNPSEDEPIESGTGGAPGGSGPGGSSSSVYNVNVIYPEVKAALLSQGIDVANATAEQLDTIWKTLANDGSKQLYVTSEDVDSSSIKTKNHFYFDNNSGNMVYGPSSTANPGDKGKPIKLFQKAVLVEVNGSYVIGGLYKVANIDDIGSIKGGKDTIIRHAKIGFNTTAGNFEVVYINPNSQHKGGYGFSLIGNDETSTASKTKDDFGIVINSSGDSILKQNLDGINNPKSNYKSRCYRF